MTIIESIWPWKYGNIRVWESEQATTGNQPPVLLIHGFGASVEHWDLNIPVLAETRKVYALDLLGFGLSDKPEAQYSLALWAEQFKDFLTFKGEKEVALIGHSMGGAASLFFADAYPDCVERLVLVDASGVFPEKVSPIEQFLFSAIKNPIIGNVAFSLFGNRYAAKQNLILTYYNEDQVTDELVEQFSRPLKTDGAVNGYLAPSRNPEKFRLRLSKPCNFAKPALIVWGEYDKAFAPAEMLPKFKEFLPQAETHIMLKTAHCPHHEKPDEFNAVVKRFFA